MDNGTARIEEVRKELVNQITARFRVQKNEEKEDWAVPSLANMSVVYRELAEFLEIFLPKPSLESHRKTNNWQAAISLANIVNVDANSRRENQKESLSFSSGHEGLDRMLKGKLDILCRGRTTSDPIIFCCKVLGEIHESRERVIKQALAAEKATGYLHHASSEYLLKAVLKIVDPDFEKRTHGLKCLFEMLPEGIKKDFKEECPKAMVNLDCIGKHEQTQEFRYRLELDNDDIHAQEFNVALHKFFIDDKILKERQASF